MNLLPLQRRLRPLLGPAAAVYGAALRLRAARYASPIPPRPYRAACPVVSVGNIAWGGSGKTPVVDYLLDWAERASVPAVVLTRGYKASPPSLPFSVRPDSDARAAGDEPLLLARRHPQSLVLVDPKRRRAAAWAEQNAAPRLFLLDDGMQHLDMGRDLNLVLLRPEDLLDEWNRVIPAGSWREDASALERADAFCIKADPSRFAALLPAAESRLAPYGKPLFSFHLAPAGLSRLQKEGDAADAVPDLGGAKYALACAVGNPGQVRETARTLLGGDPTVTERFDDHYLYTEADAKRLAAHGLPLVCTAKDAVKLAPLLPHFGEIPVWVLDVAAAFGRGLFTELRFDQWWELRAAELGLFPCATESATPDGGNPPVSARRFHGEKTA